MLRRHIPTLILHFVIRNRLLIFLLSLLLLILFFPIVHERFPSYLFILEIFFSFLLLMGILTISDNKQVITVAILIAILASTLMWFNLLLHSRDLLLVALGLEILFFSVTMVTILGYVLEFKKVTADKIYGAICVYLLIGIIWALFYTALEISTPGAFQVIHGMPVTYNDELAYRYYFVNFIYYSFVTLSTLGFGDITPLNSISRVFSSMEAVIGQLYTAVLIARLVGLHISHTQDLHKD